jgi:hypothetical protein
MHRSAAVASRFGAVLSGALLIAPLAHAEPQGNGALTIGGAAIGGVGYEKRYFNHPAFHLGLRGDVLFFRDKPGDFGFGPYVELNTMAFRELQFGGGASVLLPITKSFPFVASLGAFGRYGNNRSLPDPNGETHTFGLEPGVTGSLFWGLRGFNYTAHYELAAGLSVGWRHGFGESKETALLVALHLDLAALGLPFVALVNLIRGPTSAARRLP